MRVFILFLILLVLSITACDRENDSSANLNDDDFTNIDNVIVGDYTNMITVNYDTLISVVDDLNSFYVDVNSDTIFDFEIQINHEDSPQIGSVVKSKISCLHSNSFLIGIVETDTMFLYHNVAISSPQGSNRISYDDHMSYSCSKRSSEDSILSIRKDAFKLNIMHKYETILKSENFMSSSAVFYENSYGYWGVFERGDTTFYYDTQFIQDCNSALQLDEIGYVGIKIVEEERERLGWIKFIQIDLYNLLLLEISIQK